MNIKGAIFEKLIGVLIRVLDEETIKQFANTVLDFIEDYVRKSENTADDAIVLPLTKMIRNTFGIE